MLISLAELAMLKNASRAAVTKKIKSGKLAGAVVNHNGRKLVNKEEAFRLWDIQALPSKDTTVRKQLKQEIDAKTENEIPAYGESKAKREYFLAELAMLKNVSRAAVTKKIKSGKLEGAVVNHNGRKLVNKDEAIRLWDRADTRVVTTVKKELKQKIDNLSADEIPDFAESKAKREFYLAELAKLDVEEKKKELVSVDDIKKSSFAKGRAIREALTNLADRLSHQLAGEDDATVIHQIINSEHKEALNNLAQL